MPIRRPALVLLASWLLVAGWNVCPADTGVKTPDTGSKPDSAAKRADAGEKTNGGTAATKETATRATRPTSFAARAEQSFTKVVHKNFQKWDRNWDGKLSANEIDRLIADPSVNGLEAAAVAAIHRYLRSDGAPTGVTQAELLTKTEQQPESLERGTGPEVLRQDLNDGKPRFVHFYAHFASHLKKAPRDLFANDGGPTLEGIKQGALGDCYFVSVIGATVNRDRQKVRRMFHANSDGTTDVLFPGAGPVHVGRLTDGQIALTSSAADQGTWVNVLEKAFGEAKLAQPDTKHSKVDIDLDVISRGGKVLTTIQLMTGHKAFVIPIRTHRNKKLHVPTAAEIPRIMNRLDSAFIKAFATNRLVCADIAPGVAGKDFPPGVIGRHAYALLGYDASSQTVTVWNPHGKDFTPKSSPPGLKNGYPMKAGVFQLPLDDFVRIFKSVTYETSAPLPPA